MGNRAKAVLIVGAWMISACATEPIARMDAYVEAPSAGVRQGVSESLRRSGGPVEVGLLMINDTTALNSSPALSPSANAFVVDHVRQRVEESLPIRVVKVLDPVGVPPGRARPQLGQLGRDHGVEYLLVAIISSVESEVPMKLPLTGDPEQGGGRPGTPGFEMRTNALAELAVIDVTTGQVVARAEGQAWNRLNRLYVPVKSNSYPVIHRSLRVAPIYPTEDNAKDVARSLAGDEAVEQAVYRLQELWRGRGPAA